LFPNAAGRFQQARAAASFDAVATDGRRPPPTICGRRFREEKEPSEHVPELRLHAGSR
jgi:hypothetical protein